ncbi:hypothetical protein C8Q77DRAFT_1068621 [Trametes polyzona]|nr:hypothetical protein C8Q77DRAFT_1068621 [Trametes polyzona]
MSSKPANIPIVNCATTINSLAADARTLHNGFDNIQRQLLRLSDSEKPPRLTQDWRVHTEDYRAILHSSDTYATNLTSIINIYLALQGDITEEDTDDMIEELSTLRKDLEKPPPDMSKSCMELKRRIGECLSGTASAVSTITGIEISSNVPSSTYDPSPHVKSGSKKSVLTCDSRRRNYIASGASRTDFVSSWAWSIACSAFPTLRKLDGRERQDGSSAKPNPLVSDATAMESVHYDPALLQSITGVVANLEKQAQKFGVFSEVTKHLENELNAYLAAFQAVKTYQTPVSD